MLIVLLVVFCVNSSLFFVVWNVFILGFIVLIIVDSLISLFLYVLGLVILKVIGLNGVLCVMK